MKAFFYIEYFLAVRYLLLYISSPIILFIILLTSSHISIYLSRKISFFYHRIHTFSFIKIYSICTHFWKEYAKMSNILIIIVVNKIYKILFTKRKLIRYYYFINIYIIYQNRFFVSMKFVFYNFSIIKIFNFFYIDFYIWF